MTEAGGQLVLINGGDYVYVWNDAKSDCLDSRYNGPFIVLDAKTSKRHDRHGRWKDTNCTSESLQNSSIPRRFTTPLAVMTSLGHTSRADHLSKVKYG